MTEKITKSLLYAYAVLTFITLNLLLGPTFSLHKATYVLMAPGNFFLIIIFTSERLLINILPIWSLIFHVSDNAT